MKIFSKFWEFLFPKTISKSSIVDDESRVKPFLEQEEKLTKRNKIILVIFIVIVLLISIYLYHIEALSKDAFSTIFSAIIGGFVGASISYIVQS